MIDGSLWLAGLVALITAVSVARVVHSLRSAPRWATSALGAVTLSAATLRWLSQDRWTMYYTGYGLFEDAVSGQSHSKYGPTTYALHHGVQRLFGPSLEAYVHTHRVLDCLTPLAGASLCRLMGLTWRGAVMAALMIATAPLLVAHGASESQLVPVSLWLLTGLALLGTGLKRSELDVSELALGVAAVGLTIFGRPEMMFIGPVALWATCFTARVARRRAIAAVALAVALALGRAATVTAVMEGQRALGNTPKVFEVGPMTLLMTLARDGLVHKSLLWRWDWLPALLPLAALTVGRRRLASWWLVVVVSSCVATVDLPWLSLARVHTPSALWLCLLAAGGLERWWRPFEGRRSGAAVVLATLWALSCLFTVPSFQVPHLAQVEHDLILAAQSHLKPTDILGRRDWSDAPAERLHLHSPDAVLGGSRRVVSLSELARTAEGRGRRVALLGTRCWMRTCAAEGAHPSCEAIRSQFQLKPLIERTVKAPTSSLPWPFHPPSPTGDAEMIRDLDFPWCVKTGALRVGLYELTGPSVSESRVPR